MRAKRPGQQWLGDRVALRGVEIADREQLRRYEEMTSALLPPWYEARHLPLPSGRECERGQDRRIGIERRGDSTLIGVVDVHSSDARRGRFSYLLALSPTFRGQGFGYDTARTLLRAYFFRLGYAKCDLTIPEFDEPALILHGRLGFVEEGRRRAAIPLHGRRLDEILVGITVEEFSQIHGGPRQLAQGASPGSTRT